MHKKMKGLLVVGLFLVASAVIVNIRAAEKLSEAKSALGGGLVGYWNFDEGKGSIAKDSSGNNNNGEVVDAVWTKGKIGGALEFDGASAYVEIQPSKSLNLSELTIEAWIKTPDEFEGEKRWRCIVSKQGEDRDYNFYAYSEDGVKITQLHFSSKSFGGHAFNFTQPYEPLTWHYVAVTVDSAGLTNYYSDGEKIFSTQGTAGEANNEYPVMIGRADNYWKGAIDEVKIYNRALTADEIKAHFKAVK